MTNRLVEVPVEPLGKVPAKASCFIEREDTRLIAKIWVRGVLKETRRLRSTSLPVGTYDVVDGMVVHRHDPDTVIAELTDHQCRQRMESTEFVTLAKRVAKQLGGRLERWEGSEDELAGYRIVPPRKGIGGTKLVRARRDLAAESALVFRAGIGEDLGLSIVARELDLIARFCGWWDPDAESMLRELDAACGAHVEQLDHDLVVLRLDRTPKRPKPLVRRIYEFACEIELEIESPEEVARSLTERQLYLWRD